jgi:histidine phosphotransferase ChpT
MHEFSLAASVSSRICHDLVSPIGAIVNGVDLVREMGAAERSEAIGMIGQSAQRASALLQLYRIAFGAAEASAAGVARGTLNEHWGVLFAPPRVVLEWDGREGPALPRPEARLLALLLLCARSILAMRGMVRLRTGQRTAIPIELSIMAESFSSTLDLLALLHGDKPDGAVSPRAVEFVLARDAAREMDMEIAVTREEERITIGASPLG